MDRHALLQLHSFVCKSFITYNSHHNSRAQCGRTSPAPGAGERPEDQKWHRGRRPGRRRYQDFFIFFYSGLSTPAFRPSARQARGSTHSSSNMVHYSLFLLY